jgi:hypothetical protein
MKLTGKLELVKKYIIKGYTMISKTIPKRISLLSIFDDGFFSNVFRSIMKTIILQENKKYGKLNSTL